MSASITFLFTKALTHDGMTVEDELVCPLYLAEMDLDAYIFSQFRQYLEENGYDTSQMGLLDSTTTSRIEEVEKASSENEKL